MSHLRTVVFFAVDQTQRRRGPVAGPLLLGHVNVAGQVRTVHVHASREVNDLAVAVKRGTSFVVHGADGVAQRLGLTPTPLLVHVAVEQVHVSLARDGIFVRSCRGLTRRSKHELVLLLACERRAEIVRRRVQQHHGLHDVTAFGLLNHDGCEVGVFNAAFGHVGVASRVLVTRIHLDGLIECLLVAERISVHQEHDAVAVSVLQANRLVVPLCRHFRLVVKAVRLSRLESAVRLEGDVGLDFGIQRHVFAGCLVVTTTLKRLVCFERHVALGKRCGCGEQREEDCGTEAGHGCLQVGRHS